MAKLILVDLDLEKDLSKLYGDAVETIKYLQDLVSSIEKRVLGGEKIAGLKVVSSKGKREITENGLKYLVKLLGKENVYTTIEKPITLGELEKKISKEEVFDMQSMGLIVFSPGKDKVELEKGE